MRTRGEKLRRVLAVQPFQEEQKGLALGKCGRSRTNVSVRNLSHLYGGGTGLGADLECPIPVGAMATNKRLQATVVLEDDVRRPLQDSWCYFYNGKDRMRGWALREAY